MILTRSSSRNCKMTFIIGRGFTERQIMKKWKWHYLLNWVEYFDNLLRKHLYWYDLALRTTFILIWSQKIAKWHFSLVEALPSSKFWKSDNGAISWTEEYCDEILHTHWYWQAVSHEIELIVPMKFCIHIDIDIGRGCIPWDCQMTFEIGWVFAEDYCKMSRTIGRGFTERHSEKVKMALSLELSGIFW